RKQRTSQLVDSPFRRLGASCAKDAFIGLKTRIQPDRYGGAPLLGLRGLATKAHGSANRHALMNAIGDASAFIRGDLAHVIEHDVDRAHALLRPEPAASMADPVSR